MIERLTYIDMILIMLGMIPFIAWLDSKAFERHMACSECGSKAGRWSFVLPCLIESLFFIAGLALGYFGRNGGMP